MTSNGPRCSAAVSLRSRDESWASSRSSLLSKVLDATLHCQWNISLYRHNVWDTHICIFRHLQKYSKPKSITHKHVSPIEIQPSWLLLAQLMRQHQTPKTRKTCRALSRTRSCKSTICASVFSGLQAYKLFIKHQNTRLKDLLTTGSLVKFKSLNR